MNSIPEIRKSHLEINQPYFWNATIHEWKYLLQDDRMKMEIIQSLQWLTQRKLVSLYAYVIMPNHLHFVWTVNSNNRKESPQGSFLKFTAHRFQEMLRLYNPTGLADYKVEASNKEYEFWQRDSLAVPLYSRPFLLQKIDYIHNNLLAKHWRLAFQPAAYPFSSAAFYESGFDAFGILTHVAEIY